MQMHTLVPNTNTLEDYPPPSDARKTCPRSRLRGGDLPQGGTPPATGHAGRQHLASLTFLLSLITALGIAVFPSDAYASVLHFPNGGSVTRNSNGTLSGTAYVGDWNDELATHFAVTMPDGTHTYGWCQDYMHLAPAPGNYPFVATPAGNGTYNVLIDSSVGSASSRQVATSSPLVSPPQRVGGFSWNPVFMGSVRLNKSSALPGITSDNSCYSLAQARYGIWSDAACTQRLDSKYDLTTTTSGTSNEVELSPGTYWVKEIHAPTGYALDEQAHKVTVTSGESTTISVADTPLYESPTLWVAKQDAEFMSAQGSATLEGAEFTIRYYDGRYDLDSLPSKPLRTWVLRSDAEGNIVPSDDSFVDGGAFYKSGNAIVLPIGTVTIQETKAPRGYWLEGQTSDSPKNYKAPIHLATIDGTGSFKAITVQEMVKRAGLSLQKVDAQTGTSAQGDASLAGISFSIVNCNDQSVVVDGITYGPGEAIGNPLVTDSQGRASTSSNYLPVGSYDVREVQTNESMLLEADSQRVTLDEAHTDIVVPIRAPFSDRVVAGGVKVGKVAREFKEHLTQGEAVLEGAVLSIRLESEQPVIVDGALYSQGEVVCSLRTGEDGTASTGDRTLPYGTYTVFEEKAPTGFLPNDEWSHTFSIREESKIVDLSGNDVSVDDQVMRGGFSFNKVDEFSMERMELVAWRVTSATTGEWHILVSDENGLVDTESAPHDANTNANDLAVSEGVVDESALDQNAGVWFSGRADRQSSPNNELSALPYDVYRVEELPSDANEGYELVSFTVRVHKHDTHIDMGTVDDTVTPTPYIGTQLTYAGQHLMPSTGLVQLTDKVAYDGLVPGTEYTLVGELREGGTGEAVKTEGNALTSTITFVPSMSSGSVNVSFELDASALDSEGDSYGSLVAYEYLYRGDEEVAHHTEPEDEEQTVHIPRLGTTLSDQGSNKEVLLSNPIVLVDTVHYQNVIAGLRYTATGTLVDKETKEAVVDASGTPVRASAIFVPNECEGDVEVVFSFDSDLASGKVLVAFETLECEGIVVARHEDVGDANQTVRVPTIHTELSDVRGHHVIHEEKITELVDTVTYRGLEPGCTYTLTGTLVDKETGDTLVDAEGSPICATTEFVPDESVGSTLVTFKIETKLIQGKDLVAFESLSREGREVAIHADLTDEAQTVYVPLIHTTVAKQSGMREVGGNDALIVDTISYSGLRPNMTYTLVGNLIDKQTGRPVESDDGTALEVQGVFTPTESSGEIDMSFRLDASKYVGHTLVAYEFLHEGDTSDGRIVAEHADIDSEDQSAIVPKLSTTAVNASDRNKPISANGTARIRDTVQYEGLTPGVTYVMRGTLHDKDTGKAIVAPDGTNVTVTRSFVPKKENDSLIMDFSFDASLLTGSGVVVFESCLREGREVAAHADINDANQTIMVTKDKNEQNERTSGHTPNTGDATSPLLAIGLAALGISLLVARHMLR